MIFAKDKTYGLESAIKWLQISLNKNLKWLGDNYIYGLLQETKDNEGNDLLEAWKSGIKYQPVFNNRNVTSTIGFLETSRNVETLNFKADIDCIVTLNLTKAYNSQIRETEKAYLDVYKILNNSVNTINELKIGIKDVFSGFEQGNFKYMDMQPYCVFSYNCNVSYPNSVLCP